MSVGKNAVQQFVGEWLLERFSMLIFIAPPPIVYRMFQKHSYEHITLQLV